MESYFVVAMMIRILADFLLIVGVNQMSLPGERLWKGIVGAAAGGLYAAGCMLLRWRFLRHPVCYVLSLLLTSLIAFGIGREGLQKWPMFCLLRLGLDGLGKGTEELLGAMLLFAVCLYGFRWMGGKRYVPVELQCRGHKVKLKALYDTGHQLTDPITGKTVLIVGADIAAELTGLTPQQLCNPVEVMGVIPGLRLIPYQTVGRAGEMLVALRPEYMKIGKRRSQCLVAFAPQVLDGDGKFQGLIGGMV